MVMKHKEYYPENDGDLCTNAFGLVIDQDFIP